jgi:hypothetical protein
MKRATSVVFTRVVFLRDVLAFVTDDPAVLMRLVRVHSSWLETILGGYSADTWRRVSASRAFRNDYLLRLSAAGGPPPRVSLVRTLNAEFEKRFADASRKPPPPLSAILSSVVTSVALHSAAAASSFAAAPVPPVTTRYYPLLMALAKGNEANFDVNATQVGDHLCEDLDSGPLVAVAAVHPRGSELLQFLIHASSLPSMQRVDFDKFAPERTKRTAIYLAAKHDCLANVRLLALSGVCQVDAATVSGWTAKSAAHFYERRDVVQFLEAHEREARERKEQLEKQQQDEDAAEEDEEEDAESKNGSASSSPAKR